MCRMSQLVSFKPEYVGANSDDCFRPTAATLSGHEFLKQLHRKHNPAPLTELLRPLNPISTTSIPVSGRQSSILLVFCFLSVDCLTQISQFGQTGDLVVSRMTV